MPSPVKLVQCAHFTLLETETMGKIKAILSNLREERKVLDQKIVVARKLLKQEQELELSLKELQLNKVPKKRKTQTRRKTKKLDPTLPSAPALREAVRKYLNTTPYGLSVSAIIRRVFDEYSIPAPVRGQGPHPLDARVRAAVTCLLKLGLVKRIGKQGKTHAITSLGKEKPVWT